MSLNATLGAPPPAISVGWQAAPPPIQVYLPGQPIRGEQGPRGSKFLGAYPTAAALPNVATIDGEALALGDFAFVQDTGLIVQISP